LRSSYLNEEVISLLQKSYIHEIRNSLIYSEISSYLNVMGYKNLSSYYSKWSDEEREHSKWVKGFMESLNIQIENSPFNDIPFVVDKTTLTAFARQTVEVENATTEMYDELLQIAHEFTSSAMLISFCNRLISEQIEETNKALDIHDSVMNIGDNKAMLQLFDNTFVG